MREAINQSTLKSRQSSSSTAHFQQSCSSVSKKRKDCGLLITLVATGRSCELLTKITKEATEIYYYHSRNLLAVSSQSSSKPTTINITDHVPSYGFTSSIRLVRRSPVSFADIHNTRNEAPSWDDVKFRSFRAIFGNHRHNRTK